MLLTEQAVTKQAPIIEGEALLVCRSVELLAHLPCLVQPSDIAKVWPLGKFLAQSRLAPQGSNHTAQAKCLLSGPVPVRWPRGLHEFDDLVPDRVPPLELNRLPTLMLPYLTRNRE